MKKITVLIICPLVLLILFNLNINNLNTNKIVYENKVENNDLSLNASSVKQDLKKVIIIQVELVDNYFNDDFIEKQTIEIYDKKTQTRIDAKNHYLEKNEMTFNTLNLDNYESIYISKYAPFIEYIYNDDYFNEFKMDILNELSLNNNVKMVYIKESFERNDQFLGALYRIEALNTYRDRSKTGNNVIIGLLETGIINTSHSNLVGKDFLVLNQTGDIVTDHATYMASIIGGNNGLAINSKLLSAAIQGTPNYEVDWMIDNGVDVINMSFGELDPTGEYGADSAYMDYIVKNCNVTIVAASGNYGLTSALVSNPGLGYNVLTVGSSTDDGHRSDFSSYVVFRGPAKPTFVVPGSSIIVPGTTTIISGTSASCAITTGIIALLFEQFPTLKDTPEKVISLLTANVSSLKEYYRPDLSNGFNDYIGAGQLNYNNIVSNYSKSSIITNYYGSGGEIIYTKTISLNQGQTLQASIAWLAKASGSLNGTFFTDYDLKLYNSNGSIVGLANSGHSNIEIINFVATKTDVYTLKIYQSNSKVNINEKIGLSYMVN